MRGAVEAGEEPLPLAKEQRQGHGELIMRPAGKEDSIARDKPIDLSPKVISVEYAHQILPGSFEDALCYLIDQEMDLAAFAQRYRNDEGGAPAYAPALLLKILL